MTNKQGILERQEKWLWPGVIPFGTITVVAGQSMVGKSEMAADIALRISKGEPLPGMKNKVGGEAVFLSRWPGVLMFNEFKPPRRMKVQLLDVEEVPNLRHLRALAPLIAPETKLLVVDHVPAFDGIIADRLREFAQSTGIAVLLMVELQPKRSGSRWNTKGSFLSRVRIVWVLESKKDRRVLRPVKTTLAPARSYAFRIVQSERPVWEA